MTDEIRHLSKRVKSFLHFEATQFIQDPQGFQRVVPVATTATDYIARRLRPALGSAADDRQL